jgi:hypothetical protein
VTETRYLPLLILCSENEREGTVEGEPVKTLPYRALDLFDTNGEAFERKYGPLEVDEIEWLRELLSVLRFADAVQAGSRPRMFDSNGVNLYPDLPTQGKKNPLAYLQNQVNEKAREAALVLWQERKNKELSAGIFCKDIGIAAALLLLFRIASAQAGETGECLICKKLFVRERGNRRRTCSDKCRMSLSRLTRRNAKSE